MRFRFKLSKVGRVDIVVRYGGKTYLSTSASFSHGDATSAGCRRA